MIKQISSKEQMGEVTYIWVHQINHKQELKVNIIFLKQEMKMKPLWLLWMKK